MTMTEGLLPGESGTAKGKVNRVVVFCPINDVVLFEENEITVIEFSKSGVLAGSRAAVHTSGSPTFVPGVINTFAAEMSAWNQASDEDFEKFEQFLDE